MIHTQEVYRRSHPGVITDRLRDLHTELLAAYMDLHKAFDSLNRHVLWGILALRRIPPKLVNLISGLYSGAESAVKWDGTISDYFPVDTGK